MASALPDQGTPQIPVDLTVSKGHLGLTRGDIKVTDACGNLVFTCQSSNSNSKDQRTLLDAMKNPLISIYRTGSEWQGYKGESKEWKDLIFRVERTLHSRLRSELEVFLAGENCGESTSDFRLIGSPFHRSCIIYKGNSIVAQTSALYRLGKAIVGRHKFRLTLYPGIDRSFVVALLVIFFIGK